MARCLRHQGLPHALHLGHDGGATVHVWGPQPPRYVRAVHKYPGVPRPSSAP